MTSLREPGLGPIVGHTTDTTCRIWVRAGDPADDKAALDANRRTVGVIGLVEGSAGKEKIGDAWYFRLHREFDRTGTFHLGSDRQLGWYTEDFEQQGKAEPSRLPKGIRSEPLKPNTKYVVRVGTLTLDDPAATDEDVPSWMIRDRLPLIDNIKQELLELDPAASEATFRTFPQSGQIAGQMSFILGSCHYPSWWPWTLKEADRIFGRIEEHFDPDKPDAARFLMMSGDQIYADTLNKDFPLMRADTYEEFQERYTTAFGSRNMRRLMRKAPSYMAIDDHEIEDNWTQDRLHRGGHTLFNLAIRAYLSYQWSHGPRTWGRLLYYNFECAGYPVFVLDGRTQRYKDDLTGLSDNHMLGRPSLDKKNHPSQLDCLLTWLGEQQKALGDAPKFIVSGGVFAPNAMDERVAPVAGDPPSPAGSEIFAANVKRRENSDSWPGFPQTRLELLKQIVQKKIQNVVFLAGDIHCSCVAEIDFDGTDAKDLKAFSVVSSAFYWPFPFADGDPNGYVHDSRAADQFDPFPVVGTNATMHYRSFGYTQEDNFSRLDIDRAKSTLTVRVFDNKGNPIKVADGSGKKTDKGIVLQLSKW